jgi:hypothetical protein
MPDKTLPRPKKTLVGLINVVLDNLIKGLGADLAIAAGVAYAPFLGWPVINFIFRQSVHALASSLNTSIKQNLDNIIIRFQNDARKAEYDKAIEEIKKPGASEDDIRKAREAMDRLIRRGN